MSIPTTTNLQLLKPTYNDLADVMKVNDNMDILDALFAKISGTILGSVYPVGSIYMSVVSTSPATLFGGTWVRLKDRFLMGAGDTYAAGGTGGSETHTLTTNEMPSHNHTFTGSAVTSGGVSANHTHTGTSGNQSANHTHTGPSHSHAFSKAGPGDSDAGGIHNHANNWGAINTGTAGTGATGSNSANHTHTTTTGNNSVGHTHSVTASGTIGNKGGGTAFSIMPPYLSVYMWKRTA
jgi:microcystin-dependent protein